MRCLRSLCQSCATQGARGRVPQPLFYRQRRSLSSTDPVLQEAFSSLGQDLQALVDLQEAYTQDTRFQTAATAAVEILLQTTGTNRGRIFTTGIGKAGVVASRLSISLASISVPSQWVHGTEWVHGDLGSLREGDCVVAISHSGKTSELLDLASLLPDRNVPLVSIVGNIESPLATASTATLPAPAESEILGCIPSRSLIVQEAVCNMVVAALIKRTGFEKMAFGQNHPGGNIGQRLGTAKAIS
eukprot:INCI15758.2.p1 GENE.INCI15758.2~~INCI15758.2.p1  ORF type:complete len:244 (+),score=22.12 INCI15758.2:119-850(+)